MSKNYKFNNEKKEVSFEKYNLPTPWMNYLSNGTFHTMMSHAGGGVATVTVLQDRIDIVLEDHGPGIANVDLAMKEGFSTATDHIRDLGFGAGMGLPNMKKNTDSMEIQTELGKGTTIKMIINL